MVRDSGLGSPYIILIMACIGVLFLLGESRQGSMYQEPVFWPPPGAKPALERPEALAWRPASPVSNP
ncbi:hypothetical protein O4G76_08405 [Limimaricola sp. G21655-S1]|uniref:hypothetical protein n=1 Tax=Limimaricola sp. G21655-S1 TaxID=3014768 RepID=UPI0022AF12FC|nr:hypothetical protein [Limimaricola sp. G21655-S1]MCZ4260862.1 hypothetical protein [Limimaricola sp. G21655-S1]